MHDEIQVPGDNADLALLEIDFPAVSLEETADPGANLHTSIPV